MTDSPVRSDPTPFPTRTLAVTCCLVLALAACAPRQPAPTPTATDAPAATQAPATPTDTATPSPTATVPPTATPTEVSSTAPAAPPACPAPGSPGLSRPGALADYPDAIQAYLSAGGGLETLRRRLTEWEAVPEDGDQLVTADLNGDEIPEVIMSVIDPTGHPIAPPGVVLVFGCSDGAYVSLYREGSGASETFDPSTEILQVTDATTDGLSDVIYVLRSCGAHTCYERLRILSWDGAELTNAMGSVLDLPYPSFTVEPGRIQATSGGIGSVGAEPQRGYTEIWSWNGAVFTKTETIYEPPVYRYHALLDGDRALRSGDYVTATRVYERVIDDDELEEWAEFSGMMTPEEERATLSAFATWRLVLTALQMGQPDRAREAYDELQRTYRVGPGHGVAEMARDFWGAYEPDRSVSKGCDTVVAGHDADGAVLDFFNRNYGYANPRWEPRDLCPF